MYVPVFLFAADTHLQECAWVRHPRVIGDAYASLRQIGDIAMERQLNLVLAGDIFDKRLPGPESVGEFMRLVARLAPALTVHYVQGDHDFQPRVAWPATSPNVRALPLAGKCWGPYVTADPCVQLKVAGLDFTPKDLLPAALAAIEPVDIMVTHQRWQDLQGIGNVDGDVSLVHHARLLLTGDYHGTRVIQCANAEGEPMLVVSPGSTCMQALDESPNKFIVCVKIDQARGREQKRAADFQLEMIPLKTRGFASVDVYEPAQLDAVVQLLTMYHSGTPWDVVLYNWSRLPFVRSCSHPTHVSLDLLPMFHIRYRDDLPNAYQRIMGANQDFFNLDLTPRVVALTTEVTLSETPEGGFDNLLTVVDEMVLPGDPARDGLHRLLSAGDKPLALDQLIVEFDAQYDQEHAIENPRRGTDELLSVPA